MAARADCAIRGIAISFLASLKPSSRNSSWSVSIKIPLVCSHRNGTLSVQFGTLRRVIRLALRRVGQSGLFFVYSFGRAVGGTSVGGEFLVTLLLVILLHLLKRVSNGGDRRVEYPRAF